MVSFSISMGSRHSSSQSGMGIFIMFIWEVGVLMSGMIPEWEGKGAELAFVTKRQNTPMLEWGNGIDSEWSHG